MQKKNKFVKVNFFPTVVTAIENFISNNFNINFWQSYSKIFVKYFLNMFNNYNKYQ